MNQSVPVAVQARISADNKLEGRTYSEKMEVRDPWTYYDTYVLDAATSPTILFNNSSSKALSLSNYQYQQLPAGQAYDVYGLRVSYYASTAFSDVTALLWTTFINKAVMQFVINNKVPTFERNIGAIIGGAVQIITAPAVTVNSQVLSKWTADTVVKFKKKIELDQQTQWTVKILKDVANNAALTGDYLRVELIGRLTSKL